MVVLYQRGSGSSECDLGKPVGSPEARAKLRSNAVQLLQAQHNNEAADFFEQEGFELFEATNGFGDEFFALAKSAKIDAYADYSNKATDENVRFACVNISSVFSHLGFPLRFIVVDLDTSGGIDPVNLAIHISPVEVVTRALRDAEQLLTTNGAVSAIDRVHTALHGYLKWACQEAGNLPVNKDPGITELLKHAEKHPRLAVSTAHSDKIVKILRAFGSALDAINQLRNRGSMAHANDQLVDEADAMLVVNAARTIMRYFADRLK